MAAALRVGQTKKRRLAETTTGLVEQNAAAGWHYTPAQEGRPARLTNVYTGKVEAVPRVPTAPRFHPARIAVIVPFRDLHAAQQRTSHRRAFVPFMLRYLSECKLKDFTVMLVEQSDDGRKFNRGKLLNIGFDLLKDSHDAFIFHDVDLLPGDDLRDSYSVIPATGKPIHIARCWGRYSNNPKYFGGIVSFCRGDFERLNGYPNNFWGWGGEDDELYNRLKQCGLSFVSPPTGSIADLEEMSLQEKLAFLKKNPDWKNQVKQELVAEHKKTWKKNGLADLDYEVVARRCLCASRRAQLVTVDVRYNGHWSDSVLTWQDLQKRSANKA